MGLDQYLMGTYELNGIFTDWTELYSWRKANQIHGYFDRLQEDREGHCLDNCESILLSRDDLKKFVEDCKRAVEDYYLRKDKIFAEEVFPPTEGFFFGTYGMDSWYWNELENTVEALEKYTDEEYSNYKYFRYYGWW